MLQVRGQSAGTGMDVAGSQPGPVCTIFRVFSTISSWQQDRLVNPEVISNGRMIFKIFIQTRTSIIYPVLSSR
jgi:hypothetical protein